MKALIKQLTGPWALIAYFSIGGMLHFLYMLFCHAG